MAEMDAPRVARDIADLRIQVNALEVATKEESLPTLLRETRTTVRWSALVIALALIASSMLKHCDDLRVDRLEKRVENLEKFHTAVAPP